MKEAWEPFEDGAGMGSMKLLCEELVDEVGDCAEDEEGDRLDEVSSLGAGRDATGVSGRESSSL